VLVGEWSLDSSRRLVVGRSRKCDVVLDDDLVSREHLEIRPVDDGWEAVDLGSSDGTRLRGSRISHHRLRSGDRIQVGGTELLAVDLDVLSSAPPSRLAASPPPLPMARQTWAASPPPLPDSMVALRRRSKKPLGLGLVLAASLVVVAGFGVLILRLGPRFMRGKSTKGIPGMVAGTTTSPFSDAAARALKEPAKDGVARRTLLGSLTTTAGAGHLVHALVNIDLPTAALPAGGELTVSRVDAAPVAMRDTFPIARWGDYVPLSPIVEVLPGTGALAQPATISFPLAQGAKFSELAVVSWNPKTGVWDSFPARFDAASGRAVAEVSSLNVLHLLGLAAPSVGP
jgi:hypothetical protein